MLVIETNMFKELGLPDHDAMHAKSQVVVAIHQLLESQQLTVRQAAALMDIPGTRLVSLLRGRIREESLTDLQFMLNRLELAVRT